MEFSIKTIYQLTIPRSVYLTESSPHLFVSLIYTWLNLDIFKKYNTVSLYELL